MEIPRETDQVEKVECFQQLKLSHYYFRKEIHVGQSKLQVDVTIKKSINLKIKIVYVKYVHDKN